MNSRRPTTAGIDQLSRNLNVTRSPEFSILVCLPETLAGGDVGAGLRCLTGILEAVVGTAQYGGLTFPALGGLGDGGSLLTVFAGTSVGGGAHEVVACLGAVPDGAE